MNINRLLVGAILMGGLAVLGASCVKRVDNSKETREAYEKSLEDSVSNIKTEIDSINSRIDQLRDLVGVRMRDFTTVSNPREVGPYMIFTPFAGRYPLQQTGLVARIDDNQKLQLVATLSGKTFDQIAIQTLEGTLESEIVPNDQALNYRTASLTTVMFSGSRADSLAQAIADNELNPVSVIYLQGKAVHSYRLPNDQAKMISQTWLLYDAETSLGRLERRVPMLQEKINLLRLHKDR